VRLYSRSGNEPTDRFTLIVEALPVRAPHHRRRGRRL
jgi:hypothetical protein